MPALHLNETRAEKAAKQHQGKASAKVIDFPFARVTVSEIEVPPSNGAAPPNAEDQRQRCITINEKFNWIDAVMADSRLDTRAKVVAYCIMQHINREAGTAFVSDLTISHKTRIPMRWMQRARNALRAAAWITWKRTKTANVYSTLTGPMTAIAEEQKTLKQAREEKRMRKQELPRVAEPELPRVAEPELPRVAEPELPRVADIPISGYPLDEPIKESIYTASNSAIEVISAFETFWQQYPRRVGKLKAEKIYNDIIKSKRASAEELLAGAGRYAAERAGQGDKYTKHPSTWLNAGGWMDEPQAPSGLAKPRRLEAFAAGMRGFLEEGYHDKK